MVQFSRLGILDTSSPDADRVRLWEAFAQRLSEIGHVQGQNIGFEFRWANGDPSSLDRLAQELAALRVHAIVTAGTPAAFAARRASTRIPIVMATGVSVGTALHQDADRADSNITGLSDLAAGLSKKRLELLCALAPQSRQLAVLWDQSNPSGKLAIPEFQDAAHSLGVLAAMARDKIAGFAVVPSAMFFGDRKRLAELAIGHRLPAIFVRREYAQAGGLMAYGSPIRNNYLRAADYVDQILKGAAPANLPIEQPTGFELFINLRTAQQLDLTIPQALLLAAQAL
ncbi:MAG: hypothetical protein EBY24_06640 [Betaproteobacteria bacterium]|nr:hypothetical protein [Betaproteobacteria bacterium]